MKYAKAFLSLVFGFCLFISLTSHTDAAQRIRFATVAPEGTSWLKEMRQMAQDVKTETKGQLQLKIYDSSKMGDELDVLRKMRSGQIHAGAFTGFGLGAVDPAIRIMELPFLFENDSEIDFVYKKLHNTFAKRFEQKGMILLDSGDAGRVHIFSKDPLGNRSALERSKMWVWEGDPLASAFFTEASISPIPLPITEVITGLQTGMINGVYVPPMGAIGFQWWTKVGYMTTPKLNNVAGGILITKKMWAKLSPAHQKVLMKAAKQAGKRVTAISRSDNNKAVDVLAKNKVKVVEMDAAARKEFQQLSLSVRKKLVGKLFTQDIVNAVERQIKAYRSGQKKS